MLAPFDKKDLLKARKYRWEDGLGSLPKCWRTTIASDLLEAEQSWLDKEIYGREGASRMGHLVGFRFSVRKHLALSSIALSI